MGLVGGRPLLLLDVVDDVKSIILVEGEGCLLDVTECSGVTKSISSGIGL
jgi:hypothetical protein